MRTGVIEHGTMTAGKARPKWPRVISNRRNPASSGWFDEFPARPISVAEAPDEAIQN